VTAVTLAGIVWSGARIAGRQEGFRFRSAVELINVSATVTDRYGRFVAGLTKDDFRLYEDSQPQNVTHFSNERVPVSLGIVIDTSGSMAGEKWEAARAALDRFVYDLLDPEDEIFIYRFSNHATLLQDWTSDRTRLSRALSQIHPNGGTAMYDAIAEAVPMAQEGRQRKKAIVLISDGNDTNSQTAAGTVRQIVRETEVLVYAVGIDGHGGASVTTRLPIPLPIPFPLPGRRRPTPWPPGGGGIGTMGGDQRVNVAALRAITDDSGGRTEIVRGPMDIAPATAGIADELSKQYYLGYTSANPKDGRWHRIDVQVRDRDLTVRARRGYVATP
jgi:VWFA-related protein